MATHLSFQVEAFSAVQPELLPLFPRHWEELALDKEEVPLDPDWARYAQMEATGAISMVTARENGRLVGYCIMLLGPGLHYRTCYDAKMDIFWIAPEQRGHAMPGLRLFRAVEKELRRRGVQRVYLGSKLHKDVGRLFVALGYHPVETWYSKMLSEDG